MSSKRQAPKIDVVLLNKWKGRIFRPMYMDRVVDKFEYYFLKDVTRSRKVVFISYMKIGLDIGGRLHVKNYHNEIVYRVAPSTKTINSWMVLLNEKEAKKALAKCDAIVDEIKIASRTALNAVLK